MAIELSGLFTPKQAAAALGIHEKSIFRWLRAGKVQVVLVAGQRFIPESEVERLNKEKNKAAEGRRALSGSG